MTAGPPLSPSPSPLVFVPPESHRDGAVQVLDGGSGREPLGRIVVIGLAGPRGGPRGAAHILDADLHRSLGWKGIEDVDDLFVSGSLEDAKRAVLECWAALRPRTPPRKGRPPLPGQGAPLSPLGA